MLGLKNLTFDRLTTAFMVISAAMMIFAVAGGAGGSSSTTMLLVWIVCALVLIGAWITVAVEIYKRFFGGGERREDRSRQQHADSNEA